MHSACCRASRDRSNVSQTGAHHRDFSRFSLRILQRMSSLHPLILIPRSRAHLSFVASSPSSLRNTPTTANRSPMTPFLTEGTPVMGPLSEQGTPGQVSSWLTPQSAADQRRYGLRSPQYHLVVVEWWMGRGSLGFIATYSRFADCYCCVAGIIMVRQRR
jgi:hypothetical protein